MSKARDLASGAPAPAGVTTTELGYVDGVSSAIQTQIDSKEPTLPSQTGNSGKYLTTNGTTKSWGTVSQYALPSQTGNSGKFLTTDGTSESWGTVSAPKKWTGYSTPAYGDLSGAVTGAFLEGARTKVYYMGGYYIFGANRGVIGYSTDAKNWSYQVLWSTNNDVYAIAYNGTTFVVVGNGNNCFSGTPGGTWTARTSQIATTLPIYDVLWVGGSINLFVLCGGTTPTSNVISTSPDGITWTARQSSGAYHFNIQTNTAQNVIVVGSENTTVGAQGYYSTNGTTWTGLPVYGTAVAAFGIWYQPHVDKFVALGANTPRRASASIGTTWNAGVYEQGTYPNNILLNQNTAFLPKHIPIWDSVNSRYYTADAGSTPGVQNVLITYGNTDTKILFSTGNYNRYSPNIIGMEPLPGAYGYGAITSQPTASDVCAIGYGNGIWVCVSSTNSYQGNRGLMTVYSTAV